jgi:hypothetical protein
MPASLRGTPTYALGHSEHELKRLSCQGKVFEAFTRQLLIQAGIHSGMRVLDVGSGAGDSSFLVAELVGQLDTRETSSALTVSRWQWDGLRHAPTGSDARTYNFLKVTRRQWNSIRNLTRSLVELSSCTIPIRPMLSEGWRSIFVPED